MEKFYKRLYGEYELFADEDEYFQRKSPFGKGEAPQEQGDIYSKYHFEILNLDEIKYSDSLEQAIKRNETVKNRII